MKNLFNYFVYAGCIMLFVAFPSRNYLFGQSEAESASGLTIQHTIKEKRAYHVPAGKKITVWTKDGSKTKGVLKSADVEFINIDGKEIAVSEITALTVRSPQRTAAKWVGIGMVAFGLLAGLVGFLVGLLGNYMVENNGSGADGCVTYAFGLIFLALGIVLGAAGGVVFFMGFIPLIIGTIAGKKFKMGVKWKISSGQ